MIKMWINKGEYGFSTRLKDGQEGGPSMFMGVQFKKGNEPEGNCQIEVKDGFFSCYNSKDGVKPKIVVMDYAILEGHNSNTPKETKVEEKTSYTAQELADEAMADFGDIVEIDNELAF